MNNSEQSSESTPTKKLTLDEKRELVRLLTEKEKINKQRKLAHLKLTPLQLALFRSKEKIVLFLGGNRSGKSHAIAADAISRLTGVIPEDLNSLQNELIASNFFRIGEAWLSGLDFTSLMGIVKQKVDFFLPPHVRGVYNKEMKIQRLRNDSVIQYRAYEQGREAFQGRSIVYMSFDEEPPEDVYHEGYMRTVDCEGLIRLAFTPMKGLSWAYTKLYMKAGKRIYTENTHGIKEGIGILHTPEELKLMRDREVKVAINTAKDADHDIVVIQNTIYDNPHLPLSEVWKAEKEFQQDPVQYQARILGRFSTVTGRNVFDAETLLRKEVTCPKPQAQGEIVNGQFQKSLNGNLLIYKDLRTLKDDAYVIGADVAEGLEQGDFSCAQVLSKRNCEQVAVWHGKIAPENFAGLLVSMGRFFNNADIAPERNFHGYAVVTRIKEHYQYPNLYSEYSHTDDVKTSSMRKMTKRYGWHTDAKSKPIMIQELGTYLSNGHIKINDINTIKELGTYTYDKNGGTEALGGCFDDRVVALAIALQVWKRRPYRLNVPDNTQQKKRDEYTGY